MTELGAESVHLTVRLAEGESGTLYPHLKNGLVQFDYSGPTANSLFLFPDY